jgi:hypothetical protein
MVIKGIYTGYIEAKNEYDEFYDKLSLLDRMILYVRSCFTNTK